ncbi:Aste57867_12022 [Aphanomyces stellatus]|uniref:Hexose transporter 1 n=1 Tax=Aphanomyces stellatus TaxID=120398 RepID=A0A485KUY6_9STRA|nr:hypothetical protein As57867_011977 [Aphanomyces stellatus]VFT88877.1 Aste57867_12022 [Aphanomyces stellatus]
MSETPATPSREDIYIPIQDGDSTIQRIGSAAGGRSFRKARQQSSRRRLSRLESLIHEEHADALLPTKVLYVSVLIALMGAFQFGWLLSQLNYLPFNTKKTCAAHPIQEGTCIMFPGHSKHEWTMNVTAWIVGGALGAVLSGIPADKFGRKRTTFLNAFVMITGALVEVVAKDIYVFSLGRLLSGIATGTAINVSNVLISEISPSQMRGLFSTGLQVGVALGSLAVTTAHYVIGSHHEYAWRLLVGFPIVLGGVQILLMPLMTQSPVWLVAHGKVDAAAAEMRRLYQPTNYDAILKTLVAAHDEEQREIAGINPWSALFSRKYMRQLLIAITLCSAQQLCGINAIMYYSAAIFNSAGITDPRVANTIVNLIRTASILVAAKVMDKFKRKTLLCGGMTIMAIAGTGLVYALCNANSAVAVASVGIYVAAFCLSIGPMAWMVSSELFPDFLHANAGSVGTMFTWVCNFLIGVYYPILSSDDKMGNYAFCIFIGLLVAFVLFVFFVVPETGHKTYVEIQQCFGIDDNTSAHHDDGAPADPWATDK